MAELQRFEPISPIAQPTTLSFPVFRILVASTCSEEVTWRRQNLPLSALRTTSRLSQTLKTALKSNEQLIGALTGLNGVLLAVRFIGDATIGLTTKKIHRWRRL